jgi:hypothetical protein
MRCGKCGRDAASVSEVKACHDGATDAHGKFVESGLFKVTGEPDNPPTKPQVDYLLGLQEERIVPDGYTMKTEAEVWLMERPEVSAQINMLKLAQKKDSGKSQPEWTMPAGRYALKDDEWAFYEVNKPTEGRWAGYTFIKRLVGAPGQYQKYPIEAAAKRNALLERIERDPKQAMIDYGLQSGVCGRCSSPLTDPVSLERGIGPKCASKDGWF